MRLKINFSENFKNIPKIEFIQKNLNCKINLIVITTVHWQSQTNIITTMYTNKKYLFKDRNLKKY